MDDRAARKAGRLVGAVRAISGSTVARRLISGSFANFADKLALLAVQLTAIPLLSQHWGAEGLGTWLMLMTVPTYVALSDFGLWTVAGVEITQKVANDNHRGASEVFQSAWTIVLLVLALITSGAIVYCVLGLSGLVPGGPELSTAVLIVTLYGVAVVQMATLAVVYRATNKFAHAAIFSTVVTIAEGLALIATVALDGGLLLTLTVLLAVRTTGWIASYAVLRRVEPWARIGFGRARWAALRRLAQPSIAALSFAAANSISLQGAVLVLGWVEGPGVAAVFGAARFVARVPLQFSGLVVRASIPELTRAQVSTDRALQKRLAHINVLSALGPTLPAIPILIFVGPHLLPLISGGKLQGEWWLFALLATTTALAALWQAMASPLVAANQQAHFAYAYALFSTIAVSCVFLPGVSALPAIAMALLGAETATGLLVAHFNSKTDRDR